VSGLDETILTNAREGFRLQYGEYPEFVVRAPGRVNIIGEHTDYNEGYVLPMALPYSTVIAASPISGNMVTVFSEGFGPAQFVLTDDPAETSGWSRYIHGMGSMIQTRGFQVLGWKGFIYSDIPSGANLSSSAALEIAAGVVFQQSSDIDISLMEIAALGRDVENNLMGVRSGIMDQLTCAFAESGAALLIDCRSLKMTPIELPKGASVVLMDTGTRRELSGTEYNKRRATCDQVASALGVQSLRDATIADLSSLDQIAEIGLRRAQHVLTENIRVLDAVNSMKQQRLGELGGFMNASHESLREDYNVSGPALDRIVEIAQSVSGCYGARMTGGGFAGSAVAIVDSGQVQQFCEQVSNLYRPPSEQPAETSPGLYPVEASAGVSII